MAESLFGQSVSLLLFVAGAILLVAEAFAPGAHLFVLGVALLTAGLTGLALGAVGGLGIFAPIILAVVVLAVTGLTLWGYRKLDIYGGEGAAETSHSGSLQGQFGTVTERVTTSDGEVKLDDGGFNPYYRARSVDGEIEVGTEVMVVDPGGGNVVTVEPVAGGTDEIDRELERGRDGASALDSNEDANGETGPGSDAESVASDAESTDESGEESDASDDVESERAS